MQNGHALTQDICQNLKMGLLPGAFSLMGGAAFGATIGVKRNAPLLPQRADIKSPTPPTTAPALRGRFLLRPLEEPLRTGHARRGGGGGGGGAGGESRPPRP